MVKQTLAAMLEIIPHQNTVDVWLLDEDGRQDIKAECEAMGVKYFSRHGLLEYNCENGAYRAGSKHGNHNAWRDFHESEYDIVAQMDPDHVPHRDFLARIVGYFNNPETAFVVAPQVYGNQHNWIARGDNIWCLYTTGNERDNDH